MKVLFTFLSASLLFTSSIFAQNSVNLDITLNPGREILFNASGGNSERMYYRFKNGALDVPQEVMDDMFNLGDQVYRWPGGATANFYHFDEGRAKGYGLSRYEVDFFEHSMTCNIPNDGTDNCQTFDVDAPRNYLYDFLEFSDEYKLKTGKPIRMVWIPNLLTFFVHDQDFISLLDKASSLADVATMVQNSEVSQGFYNRLKENMDVYQILLNHPSIDLEGIEYGNELYFHKPVVTLGHDATNAIPRWLFELNKERLFNDMRPGISKYRSIIDFYNKAFKPKENGVKTGVPVSIIPHTGNQAPFNLLYNTLVKDSLADKVDALIHHFYFKLDGPDMKPETANSNPTQYQQVKDATDDFIHVKLPKIDLEYDKFFQMKEKGKRLWITEYNLKHGAEPVATIGFQRLWMNMFYHTSFLFESFLSFIDNVHDNDLVEYAFKHLWVGRYADYNYSGYSIDALPDGSFNKIKRASYSTMEILGGLTSRNLKKLNFSSSNSLGMTRKDLHFWTYYEGPNAAEPGDAGKIFILYSNKSGQKATIDLGNGLNLSSGSFNIDSLIRQPSFAAYASAEQHYSSNGKTLQNPGAAEVENIKVTNIADIDKDGVFEIPGFSIGYLAIPFKTNGNVNTGIKTAEAQKLILYPNPTDGALFLSLPGKMLTLNNSGSIKIIDVAGRLMNASSIESIGDKIRLELKDFAPGLYTVSYQNDKFQASGRFVVQ